ncbi:peptidoglycan DD-metalloendopeptidase family protein [Phormidium sp. LEGE 05292]|uniref:peptidoglycan DD-metalloendopeptidase family protein n=1 Tax=[Phormidium] sp. LEGE 05292 TaxID=767427 RepID=UPI0018811D4C|nr:peptidoglycan DD-metalloendopeptidase family protein [Phormidium sp. LEGE 05292]MBE9226420.1 peptidoglycan DD-metalloendopeptidase family protein [Phormidium sp. LEGE 05292]
MKRALTQKINPIPACTADCSMVGSFKPIPPEVNRRARTSAAMIGLAISMGASSSVLLPRQGDSAVATEPKANWAVSTVTNSLTETMGSQEVKSVTEEALEPKPLAHQNQELSANASSTEGNSVNQISSLNHNSDGTESQSAILEQPAIVSETPSGETATASSVDQLLKVKQAVALNRLKESSNRLRNSLAEWKSEESSIKSSVPVSEPVVPTVVSRQLHPIIESSPAVEPVSPQWQAQVATVKPTEMVQPKAKAELGQQLQVEEPTISVVYQVRPGDTIEAIARKYDVSVATLAKANQLDNPNRIRVAQQLKVPQNTVSALPISTQQSGTKYSEFHSASPNLAPETLSSNAAPNLPVVSALLPQPISENAPADVTATAFPLTQQGTDDVPGWDVSANEPVESISASATGNKFLSASKPTSETHKDNLSAQTQNNQFVLAENITNQEPENRTKQYSNPYVERLRAEILQLRQHGRQQAGANPPANNAWYGRTATPPTANTNNSAAQLRGTNNYPVNPDFRPNQYNQALQAEIQRRAEEAPANLPRTYYQIPPTQNTRQQRVATAPLGVDPYQPYNQNTPGQTVSPDLPPIENPYNNYPGANQQMTGYMWPARGTLTSGYGWRWGRMHRGIDIAAPTGTPIFASAPGVVVYARWNSGGYGNLVQIRHPDGSLTRYAHNSRIFVQEGQIVEQGQNIAAMGTTGRSTGPHCHFEVHPEGQGAVNPIAFLPRSSR